ncbi:SigB/SigF/SigG family RNA polymerase sigma factor [Amycolatopsis circi]|uniref:SigB/SigF/SigG family RNA polymerase sigma factor n=1 Tax=Amycolatopsis circi TaxID=871959 RepID=UPI0013BE8E06|nr:SigB/SigF/SigG family RNA polymerase sigma factor [Amycolatopsis circi]
MTAATMTRTRRKDDYRHCAVLFEEISHLAEDTDEHSRLRRRLIEEHLPLAEHIARRFARRGQPSEDLLQVARIGLINAVDRYDPARQTDFVAFAVPTVMGEVRRYFRDHTWSVRVPRRLKELHLRIGQTATELGQRLGRAPTARELADHLDLDLDEVAEALHAGNAYQAASIDYPAHDDTGSIALADTLGDSDPEIEKLEDRETLKPLLRELPERERAIIVMRFFSNMTQSQIAEKVGLSQMQVSRLLARTLSTLREQLTEAAGSAR